MDIQEKQLLAGDPEAFEAFVSANEKAIYNYCLRQCGNTEDAADLTQEVFLRAWRGLSGFAGRSSLRTWLYQIAVHTCVDFARKRKRRIQTVSLTMENDDGEETTLEPPDLENAPETLLEQREQKRLLETGLASLPVDYRRIVTLRELGGLSYQEIGEVLGLSEGTVKSRLFRAREKLASWLRQAESGNKSGKPSSKKHRKGE